MFELTVNTERRAIFYFELELNIAALSINSSLSSNSGFKIYQNCRLKKKR